jgi:hypothetical protein
MLQLEEELQEQKKMIRSMIKNMKEHEDEFQPTSKKVKVCLVQTQRITKSGDQGKMVFKKGKKKAKLATEKITTTIVTRHNVTMKNFQSKRLE